MKDVFTSGDIKAMDAHEIALHNNELELIRRAGSLVVVPFWVSLSLLRFNNFNILLAQVSSPGRGPT